METNTRKQRIEQILVESLKPSHLEIIDESYKHAGHAGAPVGSSETHIHLIIAAQALNGKSKVAQHRDIMTLLNPEFQNGLHALSIEVRAS